MYVCYVFELFFLATTLFFSFLFLPFFLFRLLGKATKSRSAHGERERERENEEDLPRRTEKRNETKFEDRSVSIKAISLFLLTIIDITKYVLSAMCHVM